jgi:SsrA-binding protein
MNEQAVFAVVLRVRYYGLYTTDASDRPFVESKTLPPNDSGNRTLSDNRQAGHNYHLIEKYEAGIALSGTEVKAAKTGKVQLKESYADIVDNEAWLLNAHISQYSHGNRENHEPMRKRKLLLHRQEIDKLQSKVKEKGLALVPTKLYLKNGKIKCEIAVARGKKLHDKRASEREREANEEARKELNRRRDY